MHFGACYLGFCYLILLCPTLSNIRMTYLSRYCQGPFISKAENHGRKAMNECFFGRRRQTNQRTSFACEADLEDTPSVSSGSFIKNQPRKVSPFEADFFKDNIAYFVTIVTFFVTLTANSGHEIIKLWLHKQNKLHKKLPERLKQFFLRGKSRRKLIIRK